MKLILRNGNMEFSAEIKSLIKKIKDLKKISKQDPKKKSEIDKKCMDIVYDIEEKIAEYSDTLTYIKEYVEKIDKIYDEIDYVDFFF